MRDAAELYQRDVASSVPPTGHATLPLSLIEAWQPTRFRHVGIVVSATSVELVIVAVTPRKESRLSSFPWCIRDQLRQGYAQGPGDQAQIEDRNVSFAALDGLALDFFSSLPPLILRIPFHLAEPASGQRLHAAGR